MGDILELNLPEIVVAVGGLGTAAFGLVDASKAYRGGVSNAGFGYIKKALEPFAMALRKAVGEDWGEIMRAHWINGKPMSQQKAIVKSLIRLGLDPENSGELAKSGKVDAGKLKKVVTKLLNGHDLSDNERNVLARLDYAIDIVMDAAFERADQYYRNVSKAIAAVIAVALAIVGGYIISKQTTWGYLSSIEFFKALLVGIMAVPLAPIAKDVSSALTAAVSAVQAARGRKS